MLYFLCTLISNTNWPSLKWHKAFQQISEIAVNLPPLWERSTQIAMLTSGLSSCSSALSHIQLQNFICAVQKKKKKTLLSHLSCYRLLFLQDTYIRLKLEWGLVLLTICPIRCSAVSDQSRFSVASIFSHLWVHAPL